VLPRRIVAVLVQGITAGVENGLVASVTTQLLRSMGFKLTFPLSLTKSLPRPAPTRAWLFYWHLLRQRRSLLIIFPASDRQ
jgi:hypothetical protein